jgi:amino acid transporter
MSSLEQFGYKQELRRALSTRDLVVYGMIFMLPIAPYTVFGFVWDDAKGMVPLVYLVGLVGMFFTAMSYVAMSRAFPLAGSVYAYVQRGLHPVAGFFSGWLILLDYILIPALVYISSALALRPLIPAVPEWAWLAGFIVYNGFANLVGIELTARLNRYLLVLELVTLALFIVLGLAALYHRGLGAGGLTLKPIYNPAAFSFATVASATSIGVFSFLGFDAISTLSEETRDDRSSVARATMLSLVLIGTLFMLQTWIASDLAEGMQFSSPATAFYEITERAGGIRLRQLTVVVVVIALGLANATVAQAAVSRILFAMARDGKLPAVLAKVHPRFKTPYVSTLVVAIISFIVGVIFSERLDDLTRIVNFGALNGFLLLHLSVINFYFLRQRSGDWLRHLLFPLVGFSVIAYVLYQMDISAKAMGAGWVCVGAIYYLVVSLVQKKRITIEM